MAKRGRPKGSKNKPKDQVKVTKITAEIVKKEPVVEVTEPIEEVEDIEPDAEEDGEEGKEDKEGE